MNTVHKTGECVHSGMVTRPQICAEKTENLQEIFKLIDVFSIICHLLNLKPYSNNGILFRVRLFLRYVICFHYGQLIWQFHVIMARALLLWELECFRSTWCGFFQGNWWKPIVSLNKVKQLRQECFHFNGNY